MRCRHEENLPDGAGDGMTPGDRTPQDGKQRTDAIARVI